MNFMHINVHVLLAFKLFLQTEGNLVCPKFFVQHPYYVNKCYNVSSVIYKANTFDNYCKGIGGEMASVHNKEIQDFLTKLASNAEYFIGLVFTTTPSLVYTWKDNQSLQWSNIAGSPGINENFAYVTSNGGPWQFALDNHQKILACDYTIGTTTDTHLALVGGSNTCGRVEVYHQGLWGTITDPHPDPAFGVFLCNQFGYAFDTFDRSCVVNQGTDKIWLDTYHCLSNASTIVDCVSKWGTNITSHNNDVNVRCLVKCTVTVTTTITGVPTFPSSSSVVYNYSALPLSGNVLQQVGYTKKTTSSTAYDMRPSAVVIGTAGVMVLISVFAFVMSTDCYHIIKFISNRIQNAKRILREQQETFDQFKEEDADEFDVPTQNTEVFESSESNEQLVPPTNLNRVNDVYTLNTGLLEKTQSMPELVPPTDPNEDKVQ